MWSMMLELDSNLRSIFSAHVGYITIHELQTRIAEYLDDDRPICTIAEEKARIVFVCPYLIAELAKITESYLFTLGTNPHIIFAYNIDGCFFLAYMQIMFGPRCIHVSERFPTAGSSQPSRS